MQKVTGYSCFLAIIHYLFLQLLKTLLNVFMTEWLHDWIIKLLACREVSVFSQFVTKNVCDSLKPIDTFEFTFHVIGASHLVHTPCHDKCSSLLTLESGQFDSNQSFWCDNGFSETDFQPCLKKTSWQITHRHCSWKNPMFLKQWQRDELRSVGSCGFGKWFCGYKSATCVLLSPKKNCFPIFLPRSWDICALSYTCLPVLYILAPQCVARSYNEI